MHSQQHTFRDEVTSSSKYKCIILLQSVEVYSPKTDSWTILPGNMSIGRSYTGVCIIDKPDSF